MRTKVLTLGLICLFILFCGEEIKNPYSPPGLPDTTPLPSNMDFEFEVTTSVALADETPFLTENDYCTFYLYNKGFLMGSISIADECPSGSFFCTREISLISTFQEEVMNINYMLFTTGTSVEEEWLKNAQFTCTLKLAPITEGFVFLPEEQQMIVTGWAVDEAKAIYFTLTKE